MLSGVLPDISGSLHVSIGAAGQIVTAFTLSYALLSPILATLSATALAQNVNTASPATNYTQSEAAPIERSASPENSTAQIRYAENTTVMQDNGTAANPDANYNNAAPVADPGVYPAAYYPAAYPYGYGYGYGAPYGYYGYPYGYGYGIGFGFGFGGYGYGGYGYRGGYGYGGRGYGYGGRGYGGGYGGRGGYGGGGFHSGGGGGGGFHGGGGGGRR